MIVYIYNLKTNEKEQVFKKVVNIIEDKNEWGIVYEDNEKFIQVVIPKLMRKIVVYGF